MPAQRSRRRGLALVGAGSVLAVTALTGFGGVASASSHREAPLTANDPKADNTDTYAFVSPDKPNTVTVVANWIPFEEPNGGPNFYPFANDARYNIYIDNDGDGRPDVTYQWKFRSFYRDKDTFLSNTAAVGNIRGPHLNYQQRYTLKEIRGHHTDVLVHDALVAPSFSGMAGMPDYSVLRDQAITSIPGGIKSYAGQADDPFFLDLRVFDLLYGTDLSETGQDTLTGFNVNTIALQVPKADLVLNHAAGNNPVIGVWSTTERHATTKRTPGDEASTGDWVQVSRLGNPLVNEVVVPLKYKDAFNAIEPSVDHTIAPVVKKVTHPILPKLIEGIYGINAPPVPRNDLVEIFLTGICKACGPIKADLNSQLLNKGVTKSDFVAAEELRLNVNVPPTGSPDRLGVLGGDLAGFPNGRRLTDDVVDIAVQAVEGAAQSGMLVPALADGDGVDANDVPFGSTFPYVALPNEDAANTSGFAAAGSPAVGMAVGALGLVLAIAGARSLRRRTA